MIRIFLKDGRELTIPNGVEIRVRPYRLAAAGSGEELTYVVVDAEEDGQVLAAVLAEDTVAWVKDPVPAPAMPEPVAEPISIHAPFATTEQPNGNHVVDAVPVGQRVADG